MVVFSTSIDLNPLIVSVNEPDTFTVLLCFIVSVNEPVIVNNLFAFTVSANVPLSQYYFDHQQYK